MDRQPLGSVYLLPKGCLIGPSPVPLDMPFPSVERNENTGPTASCVMCDAAVILLERFRRIIWAHARNACPSARYLGRFLPVDARLDLMRNPGQKVSVSLWLPGLSCTVLETVNCLIV